MRPSWSSFQTLLKMGGALLVSSITSRLDSYLCNLKHNRYCRVFTSHTAQSELKGRVWVSLIIRLKVLLGKKIIHYTVQYIEHSYTIDIIYMYTHMCVL